MGEEKIYTTEDIRKYLEGILTPAEMYALEKAALADPFLADAIAGREKLSTRESPETFETGIWDLQQRLHSRVIQKKIRHNWWKVAAAVFLLVTGSAVALLMVQNNQVKEVQMARQEKGPDKPHSSTPAPSVFYKDSSDAVLKKKEEAIGSKKTVLLEARSKESEAPVVENENISRSELKDTEQIVAEMRPAPASTAQDISDKLQEKAQGLLIEVEKDSLREKETDSSLEEVVVTAYKTKRKISVSRNIEVRTTDTRQNAAILPIGGWEAFDEYIAKNKNISTADSTIKGNQVVRFAIDKTGKPSDLVMERSLSAAHDAETTRLLAGGPSWEVKKGKNRKLKLTIVF